MRHCFLELVRQSQQLVRESLVGLFVLILVFKRLKWLDVIAKCDGLHAELRQQFQHLPHMLSVFSEVVGSEHLIKKVDMLDHLFPESLRLLLDVDSAIAQVVYVRYDSLHEPRQKLVAQTVV